MSVISFLKYLRRANLTMVKATKKSVKGALFFHETALTKTNKHVVTHRERVRAAKSGKCLSAATPFLEQISMFDRMNDDHVGRVNLLQLWEAADWWRSVRIETLNSNKIELHSFTSVWVYHIYRQLNLNLTKDIEMFSVFLYVVSVFLFAYLWCWLTDSLLTDSQDSGCQVCECLPPEVSQSPSSCSW